MRLLETLKDTASLSFACKKTKTKAFSTIDFESDQASSRVAKKEHSIRQGRKKKKQKD